MSLIDAINLSRENTVRDAFSQLNGQYGMVVTVIDEVGRLEGIVTEGDLRKSLLNGKSLDDKLVDVMNAQPVTIRNEELSDNVNTLTVRSNYKLTVSLLGY